MRRFLYVFPALCMVFYSINPALADMGAIVPVGDVTVEEPGQKAIIAHNGCEQILILGTDLTASKSAKAVRFIPFPSEPGVSLAPKDCFKKLGEVLKRYGIKYLVQLKGKESQKGEVVELRFHKQLGPHDVTVVKVNDAASFTSWINSFFREKGLPERQLSEQEAELVTDYVARGFVFFAFDLVELGPETKSIKPLLYRFESRHFYYPLKTSNLFNTGGAIELFVFAKNKTVHNRVHLNYYQKKYRSKQQTGSGFTVPWFLQWPYTSSTAHVTAQELRSIAPELGNMMEKGALLRAFKYDGSFTFKNDLWLDIADARDPD